MSACRSVWRGCPNAFSRAGRGFGWTRILKRFSARIDHVITCGSWTGISFVQIGAEVKLVFPGIGEARVTIAP